MPTKFTLLVASAMLAIVLVACSEDGDGLDPPQIAPTATTTRGPQSTATAGVNNLDAIVEAVGDHNVAALEALVRYEPVPCTTTVAGTGGPPSCEADEAGGTPVDVVFATACDGNYARRGELNFGQITLGFGPIKPLFGVYAIDPATKLAGIEEWVAAEYVIVTNRFGPADEALVYAIISDGEAIIGTASGCDETSEEWVQGLGEPIEVP